MYVQTGTNEYAKLYEGFFQRVPEAYTRDHPAIQAVNEAIREGLAEAGAQDAGSQFSGAVADEFSEDEESWNADTEEAATKWAHAEVIATDYDRSVQFSPQATERVLKLIEDCRRTLDGEGSH